MPLPAPTPFVRLTDGQVPPGGLTAPTNTIPFRSPPGFSSNGNPPLPPPASTVTPPASSPPPPCQQCPVLTRKLQDLETRFYASSSDPNRLIAELEARVAAMNEDQTQLRHYLAESVLKRSLLEERTRLDWQIMAEKDELQIQTAHELNNAQEAVHAAQNKWQVDNMNVTAQINSLKKDVLATEERAAAAFARDTAKHAHDLVLSQDDLANHVKASEKVQKELTDMNNQVVHQLEALTALYE